MASFILLFALVVVVVVTAACLFSVFKTEPVFVVQAGLDLLTLLPLRCWGSRHESACLGLLNVLESKCSYSDVRISF